MAQQIQPATYDGASMEHMEAYNDSNNWGPESQFDNATMFQDQTTNAMNFDFQSMSHGHDDCRPCDSPDCGEEPCPAGVDAYECYGTDCFEAQSSTVCHDASHGQCAGNAPPEVVDGAYHLLGMGGMSLPSNGLVYCDPNAHVHGHTMQNGFDMQGGFMGNGNNFCNTDASVGNAFNVNHFGPNFCNPAYCTFDAGAGYGDIFYGCAHFPEIGGNLNDLHTFHHHNEALGGICPTRMQASPITQSNSDTPSESGPHTPRRQLSTPVTASSISSPTRSTLHSRSGSLIKVGHQQAADSDEHICQWLVGDETLCGQRFDTAEDLQAHACSAHISHLTKANPGFFCQWSGCSRITENSGDQTPFAQKSKLERHMQKHTGHKSETCPTCGQKYATAQTLAQHMKTHDSTKACVCDWPGCDYATAQASQLTMHRRTMHLNSKPLICDICGVRFSESSNLSKHKKTHKEPGEYYCGFEGCGKVFKRDDQVQRHWKKHVKDEGSLLEKARQEMIAAGMPWSEAIKVPVSQLLHRAPISRKAVILEKSKDATPPLFSATPKGRLSQTPAAGAPPSKRAKLEASSSPSRAARTIDQVPAFALDHEASMTADSALHHPVFGTAPDAFLAAQSFSKSAMLDMASFGQV